jgi:hypothetical protein
MTFYAWVFDPQDGTWRRLASSNWKSQVEALVAVHLDEQRWPSDYGITLCTGKTPSYTLGAAKKVPVERKPNYYKGLPQQK